MKHKNNRKGFSLPMSMVFMLVVVMLTLVLITASLASAKQVYKKKQQKQAELNVTSTAEVLGKLLLGISFKMDIQTVNEGTPTETKTYTVSVLEDNGSALFSKKIAALIQEAEENSTEKSSSPFTLKEGITEVEGILTVYPITNKEYPGDMLISLKDKSASTTGYTVAFRLDGEYDTSSGLYDFTDLIYYSGSEVYK